MTENQGEIKPEEALAKEIVEKNCVPLVGNNLIKAIAAALRSANERAEVMRSVNLLEWKGKPIVKACQEFESEIASLKDELFKALLMNSRVDALANENVVAKEKIAELSKYPFGCDNQEHMLDALKAEKAKSARLRESLEELHRSVIQHLTYEDEKHSLKRLTDDCPVMKRAEAALSQDRDEKDGMEG